MSNKDEHKHIDHLDDFSNRIRQKMEDHRMPVDDDCWAAIASQVVPTVPVARNTKRVAMRWIGSVAAIAAVIALVFLIIPDSKPLLEMAAIPQNTDISSVKEDNKQASSITTPSMVNEEKSATGVQVGQSKQYVLANSSETTNADNSNVADTASSVLLASADNNIQQSETTDKPNEETIESSSSQDKAEQRKRSREQKPVMMLLPKKKGNDNWLLAASFSSGSGPSGSEFASPDRGSMMAADKMHNSAPILNDPGDANSLMLANNDFTDVKHDLPISFGVSVRKDLNKHIGIETGLTYTYLSSTLERVNIPKYKAKNELHYLGIPLNLVVNLLNDPKWNVYVSGGVMVEKGLQQKYTQDMYEDDVKVSSTTDKSSVNGVQWSLNAAAGASYAFYQDLSLYVEPRLSHYLDNKQPISVRTEKSNVFSLGGGLRYKF